MKKMVSATSPDRIRIGQADLISANDESPTVTVPVRIKRRGLRKAVTLPDGVGLDSSTWDTTPRP